MPEVHPTAIVPEGAQLGEGVVIGPYCVLGAEVRIGDGTRLHSHVVIDGCTTIGEKCSIFPFASLGTQTQDLKFSGGETQVLIGDRTTIREYVTVNSGTNEGEITRVGSDCHIMAYSHVAHACSVGNRVIMANCATLAGDVEVEEQAIIGGLCAVHQFCRIGTMCMIGGCTRVTQDCPPYMLVNGNPAEVNGPNSIGLKRRGVDATVQKAMKEAYRVLYRKGLSTTQALAKIREELDSCDEIKHLAEFIEASERGIIK